ncbi:UNVERIFIED_CONTAM: hypothetical protein HDU68_005130 [Siphonaria sp. JEL0065]|nr:hypothetical protein HDU68_005130 [Siphonaria sp. JEL0065]
MFTDDNEGLEISDAVEFGAQTIVIAMNELKESWPHSNTSMNNAIWNKHLLPLSCKAHTSAKNKRFQDAFTSLLGLLMFMNQDDENWLRDQEVYMQPKVFGQFFLDFESAWVIVWKQTNTVLGINATARAVLKDQMQHLQHFVNLALKEFNESNIVLNVVGMEDFKLRTGLNDVDDE